MRRLSKFMRRILSAMRGLRAKLIYTYILVTTSALLLLELFGLIAFVALATFFGSPVSSYLTDVHYVLGSRVTPFLENPNLNMADLQEWLEWQYNTGYASLPPQFLFDNPAAKLVEGAPMLIVAPSGTVLAAAPAESPWQPGDTYAPTTLTEQSVWEMALAHDGNYYSATYIWGFEENHGYTFAQDEKADFYRIAVPIFVYKTEDPIAVNHEPEIMLDDPSIFPAPVEPEPELVGIVVVAVEPPPSRVWQTIQPIALVLLGTGLLLLLLVAPFGALFGFIMSGHLTRRLANLSTAADAWSRGNFTVLPKDKSGDEIGVLGVRLKNMAEQIQNLLETRQELAAIEERNRLARELHDTVKQQTFATLMHLRAARNLLTTNKESAETHVAEAEKLVKQSQQELTLLIAELRPAALEGEGLAVALADYVQVWSKQVGIEPHFQAQGTRPLPLAVEQALYRVAQEALANVARHSGATHVQVRLQYDAGWVTLLVQDDGHGFSPQKVQKEGFGLQSMQQRMTALGGSLVINSQPQQGTTIKATAPFHS